MQKNHIDQEAAGEAGATPDGLGTGGRSTNLLAPNPQSPEGEWMSTNLPLPQQIARMDLERLRAYRENLEFYGGAQWAQRRVQRERRLTLNYARTLIDKVTSYLMSELSFAVDPPSPEATRSPVSQDDSPPPNARPPPPQPPPPTPKGRGRADRPGAGAGGRGGSVSGVLPEQPGRAGLRYG